MATFKVLDVTSMPSQQVGLAIYRMANLDLLCAQYSGEWELNCDVLGFWFTRLNMCFLTLGWGISWLYSQGPHE